ncbi:MAG: hypothetical protein D3926_12770 [Desulfobacteraceae bacterium]|nr:MAG: hypothetical protein D3926_12770 [Desulfobacteraceae bacterium]
MMCSLSNLKSQDIDEIQALESDLGVAVLAFSCHDAKLSELDAPTLEKIQALENKMGLSLVAVES